jgi:hypothetical protein
MSGGGGRLSTGYVGRGSPTRGTAQPSCTPDLIRGKDEDTDIIARRAWP